MSATRVSPGGGVYYALNRGADLKGVPILDPVRPLEMVGFEHSKSVNMHYQTQTLDLMGDGKPVVNIASQKGKMAGHAYRPATNRIALEPTGLVLREFSIEERLLDLDNDGRYEYVRSGSEMLIGTYSNVLFE